MTREEKKQKLKLLEEITDKIITLIDGLSGEDQFWSDWTDIKDEIEDELNRN